MPFFCCLLISCGSLKNSPCGELDGRRYRIKEKNEIKELYLLTENGELNAYPIIDSNDPLLPDSMQKKVYPRIVKNNTLPAPLNLYKNGINLELMVLPLKLRPSVENVPLQLNSDFNGAIFVGYSFDKYNLSYNRITNNLSRRVLNNYKFSYGGFIGLGSTFMSPTTTAHQTDEEYDGVVLQKGIAGVIEVNNFTLGIALGFDNLLSSDRKIWIYENKPYFALSVGLDIN